MKTEILSTEVTEKGSSIFKVLTPLGEKYVIAYFDFIPAGTSIVEYYKTAICTIIDAFYDNNENKRKNFREFLERNLFRNNYGMPQLIYEERDAVRERIGKKIKELRELKKIDAKTLAKTTGIDAANLCRIEQGRYSVGLDILSKIANALDYKIDLVPNDGEDEKNDKFLNIMRL